MTIHLDIIQTLAVAVIAPDVGGVFIRASDV